MSKVVLPALASALPVVGFRPELPLLVPVQGHVIAAALSQLIQK